MSAERFNPRPRLGAGATTARRFVLPLQRRFNPRPRLGAGATAALAPGDQYSWVSILARASARALHANYQLKNDALTFQSSPAPRRGRYARWPENWPINYCFNPRPRLGAGATSLPRCGVGRGRCFNPRPRLGAGATDGAVFELAHGVVSILARASARALHDCRSNSANYHQVSILARASARALHLNSRWIPFR